MDRNLIKEKFKKITLWKRGGERAPHKPLLILHTLGLLLRNNERMESYEDMENKLKKLLIAFGPSRYKIRTEYPFWRLKNDDIWEIEGASEIKMNKSGDIKKDDLIRYKVRGGFSIEIYQKLKEDRELIHDIVQELLNTNFPSSIHEDILQSVGIEITVKTARDPEFRDKLLRAYENKCAICGFDVRLDNYPVALEAAHIKWHQAGGPDIEVNGLALCSLHHKLFDRGAFTLSENLEIQISDRAFGTTGFNEWLMQFHGKKINFPQRKAYLPDLSYVIWHIREVFQGDPRENVT
ncbi:MAG: HNH endonuclease [Desulfobacterales bacterium]|nr:HNH endonuclease [Desulfobacterales bacterium]